MWFKLLMLVHLCAAFPLKCPEPAQWALRANGHCADPSKYFCLKNDLIKGYSENCTRSDFQQPGRKAVLRGGIDAEICSVERYQPFPIKFFTNASTNCMFLKSFCNEEGQIVYDIGNRNTDTTCRCDYRRGYDFIVKPNSPCFCKPLQEDCSCFLSTCSNTSHILTADYQCIFETNNSKEIQCKPTTNEKATSGRSPKIIVNNPVENNISILAQWNERAATIVTVILLFISGILMALFVLLRTTIERFIWSNCCKVHFISDNADTVTSYEGGIFALKYETSQQKSVKIYKDGILIKSANTFLILNVKHKDEGVYYAECHCIRSEYTSLTVLPVTCESQHEEITVVEGENVVLIYKLPSDGILHRLERLSFYKNGSIVENTDNIVRHKDGVSFSLKIDSVKQNDEGHYFAQVNTFKSNITKLLVQAMFASEFNLDSIIEGEMFELKCSLYSEDVNVKWLKNDIEIKQNDNISIDHSGRYHQLTVSNSKLNDSGQYSIVAGNVKKEITVHVKGLFKRPMKDETEMEGLDINFVCETEKSYPAVCYENGIEMEPSPRIKKKTLEGNSAIKCHYCTKMPMYRCYQCSNVLCEDCCLNHEKLTKTEYHDFQAASDRILLNDKFFVGDSDIIDIKAFPGGLLVYAISKSDMLITGSVSDQNENEKIKLSGRPCNIVILDRNTIAVLLSHKTGSKFDSIEIVDIRQKQIIQHVDFNNLQRRLDGIKTSIYCSMFYFDGNLYTRCVSEISVIDISGKLDRKIHLGFTPIDMCYDIKAARIYCINGSEERLICIDRDGKTMLTFTHPSITHCKRLTIDSEGFVLILCHENYDCKNFKVHRISANGKYDGVIVTGIHNYSYRYEYSSICFHEESTSIVIGFGARIYIYKYKSVNWT